MWNTFRKTLASNVRQMLPFHGFVLAYTVVILSIAMSRDAFNPGAYERYFEQFGPLYFVALPVALAITKAILYVFQRPAEPASGTLVATPVLLGQLTAAALTLGMFILFMGSFTTFKTLMPALMGGFPYDRLHADIDVLLHGEIAPGAVLIDLLGHPLLLRGLHWNYAVIWSAVTFVPVFFVALNTRGIRLRYLLSFVLLWTILGSVLACIFLSAGPVFYADVTGDTLRFGAQMHILSKHVGVEFPSYLWENHVQGMTGLGTGISAFPSMHVGAAMMNALFLRDINRTAGRFGFAYVGVILVSSVLFGWHYAIDGYVSIVVAWLLHSALKRVLGSRRDAAVAGAFTPIPSPAKA